VFFLGVDDSATTLDDQKIGQNNVSIVFGVFVQNHVLVLILLVIEGQLLDHIKIFDFAV
jgi:hypothetical protein